MKKIQKLSETLVSQIAAGEVIESPAAIIKELVENSLDAGADSIDIRIAGDGFEEIQIRDNGHGILAEDLPLAVESFTTSKISSLDELLSAGTMGFRGEALGSIASVSRLRIESRAQGSALAEAVSVDERGKTSEPSAIERGTRVVVRDLFYNVPVRREYFANLARVRKEIVTVITNLAVANYGVEFRHHIGSDEPVILSRRERLIDRLKDIWGEGIGNDLLPVYEQVGELELSGYISKFYFYRNQASESRFWVNNRPVFYKPLISLLRAIYGELMPKGRFPFTALFLTLPARDVDVNVHPQKREIRFRHEGQVTAFLRTALTRVIAAAGGISAASMVRISRPQPVAASNGEKQADVHPADFVPQSLFAAPIQAQAVQASETADLPLFPEHLTLHSRIFNTFIVATSDEALYLIDQHTAHERLNYERQLALLTARGNVSQRLALSLPLPVSVFEKSRIQGAATALARLGFEAEDLGPAGYALKAVPDFVDSGEEVTAFRKALDICAEPGERSAAELFDQLAKDLSCKFAIKKGESASLRDFEDLLNELRKCRNPMRCPHGRPTIVRIDEREIFAYFKRTV